MHSAISAQRCRELAPVRLPTIRLGGGRPAPWPLACLHKNTLHLYNLFFLLAAKGLHCSVEGHRESQRTTVDQRHPVVRQRPQNWATRGGYTDLEDDRICARAKRDNKVLITNAETDFCMLIIGWKLHGATEVFDGLEVFREWILNKFVN